MRIGSIAVIAAVAGLAGAGPLSAQSALEGPLAAPGTAPAAAALASPVKTAKPKHRKPVKTARHSDPKTEIPDYGAAAVPAQAHPVAHAADSPTSPVDFGMKWNGSSDSARETRVQNYDGNAEGTGAEVGMKLHF